MERAIRSIKQFGHGTFSSLKIRNYRLYFIGQGISLSGTWMQTIGQSWLVLELTGSGTALGLVLAAQFLPILFLAPLGGVIADRFSKRKILFITQTAAGLLAFTLAALVATHAVALWMVYALASALGVVNALDNPTRQTFVFEMVGHEDLRNAVTLNSTEVNLARVVGPAIAGIIIASIGIAACFFINAASFIPVLICLWMMDKHTLHRHHRRFAEHPLRELKRGLGYVWRTPLLRDLLIIMAIVGTFTYEFQVSLALLAKYAFGGDAGAYALLTSAFGMGSVIGGVATAARKKTDPKALATLLLAFGTVMIAASLMPTMPLAVATMLMVGFCSICFTSLGNTILQTESAPDMRSRVMALWSVAFLGTTPIGGPIIGWIGEHADPRWGLAAGGIAAIVAGILGTITLKKYATHAIGRNTLLPTPEK